MTIHKVTMIHNIMDIHKVTHDYCWRLADLKTSSHLRDVSENPQMMEETFSTLQLLTARHLTHFKQKRKKEERTLFYDAAECR